MTWADRLQTASFRGIEFGVKRREQTGGRRISTSDTPYGETPITEDMGRMAQAQRVVAFLVGEDYLERAKRLIDALEAPGAGRLQDPWIGEKWVHVVRWSRSEGFDARRYVEVSIYVQEADEGAALKPITLDSIGEVDQSAKAASDSAEGDAAESLSVDGPEFLRDPISIAATAIGDLLGPLGTFTDVANDISAQASRVNALINNTAELINAPANLAAAIRIAVDGVAGTFTNALDSLYAYETLFGVSVDGNGGTSELSLLANRNGEITTELARTAAVAGAARSAVRVDWISRVDAIDARDRILTELDSIADTAGDDSYLGLQRLRVTIVDMIPRPDRDIPYVGHVTLQRPIPAVVLAYREYGSIDRESELAERNNVAHPGFMPPGIPLEVLQDG